MSTTTTPVPGFGGGTPAPGIGNPFNDSEATKQAKEAIRQAVWKGAFGNRTSPDFFTGAITATGGAFAKSDEEWQDITKENWRKAVLGEINSMVNSGWDNSKGTGEVYRNQDGVAVWRDPHAVGPDGNALNYDNEAGTLNVSSMVEYLKHIYPTPIGLRWIMEADDKNSFRDAKTELGNWSDNPVQKYYKGLITQREVDFTTAQSGATTPQPGSGLESPTDTPPVETDPYEGFVSSGHHQIDDYIKRNYIDTKDWGSIVTTRFGTNPGHDPVWLVAGTDTGSIHHPQLGFLTLVGGAWNKQGTEYVGGDLSLIAQPKEADAAPFATVTEINGVLVNATPTLGPNGEVLDIVYTPLTPEQRALYEVDGSGSGTATQYDFTVHNGRVYKKGSDGTFSDIGLQLPDDTSIISAHTNAAGDLVGVDAQGLSTVIEEGFTFAQIDPQETADQLQANTEINQTLEQAKFDLTKDHSKLEFALETAKFNADRLYKDAALAEQAGQFTASLALESEAQVESSRATNLQAMLGQQQQKTQSLDQIAGFLRNPSDAVAASFALTGDADPSGFVSQADLINKAVLDYDTGAAGFTKMLNERSGQKQRMNDLLERREETAFQGGQVGTAFDPRTGRELTPDQLYAQKQADWQGNLDAQAKAAADARAAGLQADKDLVAQQGADQLAAAMADTETRTRTEHPDSVTSLPNFPYQQWLQGQFDNQFPETRTPDTTPTPDTVITPAATTTTNTDTNTATTPPRFSVYEDDENYLDANMGDTAFGGERTGGFAQKPVVVGEDGAELAIPLEDGGMMVLNQNQLGFDPQVLARNRANAARRGGRYPVRSAQTGGIFPVTDPTPSSDFAIPGFSGRTFSQQDLQNRSNRLTPPRARQVTQQFGSGYSPAPMVPFKQEVGGTTGFASPTPGYLAGLTANEREFLRTNLASRNINLADVEQNASRLFGSTGARSGRRSF